MTKRDAIRGRLASGAVYVGDVADADVAWLVNTIDMLVQCHDCKRCGSGWCRARLEEPK